MFGGEILWTFTQTLRFVPVTLVEIVIEISHAV